MIAAQYLFLKKYTLLVMDCIIINSGFLTGYLYNYATLKSSNPANKGTAIYLIVFNLLWFIISSILKLYSTVALKSVEIIFRRTWRVTAVHLLLVCIILFFAGVHIFSFKLTSLEVCYVVIIAGLVSSRFFITYIVEFIIKKGKFQTKTAIIGLNPRAEQLAAYFNNTKSTYSFQGYFSDGDRHSGHHALERGSGRSSILAPVDECIDYAVAEGISEIYSTLLPGNNTRVNEILEKAERNCVRIKFIADDPIPIDGLYYPQQYIDGLQIITHRQEPLEDVTNKVKKRTFDIVLSLFAIIFILSWLVPLVGLLIKLESKGPVFFMQKRSGRNNRIFWCIKFRSMRVGDPNDTRQAGKEDSRITWVGAFLRKNSIDELPQFLNVLIGNMSIIGPRPHMLAHTEKYSKEINSFMVRHLLKPGISGWAQVNGLRGETKDSLLMQKRVEYDLWYIENWSLMLDVKIVFMTVINIFKGEEKAY